MSRRTNLTTSTSIPFNPEGDNEQLDIAPNITVTADGGSVIVTDEGDDNIRVNNQGTIRSVGEGVQTIVVGGDVRIDNASTGSIEAEGAGATAIEVVGENAQNDGELTLRNDGNIFGTTNAINFANGGESEGSVRNTGTIASDSRAINVGGEDISIDNRGEIIGTGDQRNGTIYTDATSEGTSISNRREGVIDAGEGNNGSGISYETGSFNDDFVLNGALRNDGLIQGRGDSEAANQIGHGVRVYTAVEGQVELDNDIINNGTIRGSADSDLAAGIAIEDGVNFSDVILNNGTIEGNVNAIDAREAGGSLRIANNGTLNGDVLLGEFADQFRGRNSDNGLVIDGNGGDDDIDASMFEDTITGGFGDDIIDGNGSSDTVLYNDFDAAVTVDLDAGTATRVSGFEVSVENADLASLTTDQTPAELVEEAVAGNLYFNVHTQAFPGGEIRGQLDVVSDHVSGGVRTITLEATLTSEQEPEDASDSEASGQGTVTIVVDGDSVTYSSHLDVDGIFPEDLMPVAGVSAIHLHNAPDGVNGPVITDIVQDAGGDINGDIGGAPAPVAEGDGDVFENDEDGGFDVSVSDAPLASLTTEQGPAELVEEAVAGNLYFNIHTEEFPGGEIRGQLGVSSDTTDDSGVRTIVLDASLDAAQEPDNASDSDATGSATVTIVVDGDDVSYSSELSVDGISPDELMPVAGVSSIHLHNAPAGVNGPVITDIIQDAGGDINGQLPEMMMDAPMAEGSVFMDGVETDSLESIENVVGSSQGDTITGDSDDNELIGGGGNDTLVGGAGDDVLAGGGGVDSLDGGEGNDTNSFQGIGGEVVANLGNGQASYVAGNGNTVFETFQNFENFIGSDNDDILMGDGMDNVIDGALGDDELAGGGGNDTLIGGAGDDNLRGGGGNDFTDGGEGIDTADFSDIGPDVTVDLAAGTATYVNGAGANVADTLVNIENVTGSSSDDHITGDAGDNLLAGGAGSDTLIGGAGNDVLRGDAIGDGEAVTITLFNALPEGGTFLTPVWFGFHDGAAFDLFDAGSASSQGLERLAEDGFTTAIAAEFNDQAAGTTGVDATIIGPDGVPGPIDPMEMITFQINVNPDEVGQGFFTWATMVIPSNDAFLAVPDNALADPIFDENGNFMPLLIERFGSDVLDAGTEVNDELGAAFLNQTMFDQGTAENGVVGDHPGFNGSVGNPVGDGDMLVLGGTTVAGAVIDPVIGDFTADDDLLFSIEIDRLEGSDDVLDGGDGDDIIEGGAGFDTLTGGAGADVFVFRAGDGPDNITDFTAGEDRIEVIGFDFSELEFSQDGSDAVVGYGDGEIRLSDTDHSSLSEDDFLLG